MLTLTGYTSIVQITKTSGRFFALTMSTPEEITISATMWTDGENGILRKPEENGIYHFSGYLSGPETLELTSLVPVPESQEPAPPTVVTVTGMITGPIVVQDEVHMEFDVFVKETKTPTTASHTISLHGSRWESRKKILRPGNVIHAFGTLDSLTSSAVDEIWLLRNPLNSGSISVSPRRERKAFAGCLKREAAQIDLESEVDSVDMKVDGRPVKKGKGKN